jgi:single-stranded-DNA-specific exonuclease
LRRIGGVPDAGRGQPPLRAEGVQGPDLMAMLDLVALATVADVAPLVGVNRALVRQGLRVMARRERPGLVALADVARMDQAPDTLCAGLCAGPAGQCGRADRAGRSGRAAAGDRRSGRGRGPWPPAGG